MRTLVLFLMVTAGYSTETGRYSDMTYRCAGGGALGEKWDLWREGTCLRGASLWQKVLDPDEAAQFGVKIGPPYPAEDFQRLSAWGANYLHLSVPGLFTETPPYRIRADVKAHLDELLDRAEAADLFVVLAFRTGPGRNEAGFDESQADHALHEVWKSQAAQDAWVEMWRETAKLYRDRHAVVGYDLMVEPNGNSVLLGLGDPGEFYAKYEDSLYDWNQLACRIIEAVRDVDGETPILMSGMNHSDLAWLSWIAPFTESKIVYQFHQYRPYVYTHLAAPSLIVRYPGSFTVDGVTQKVDADWLEKALEPAEDFRRARGPVAVTEYGVKRWAKGAAPFLRDQMEAFERHGMNHAVWLWESSHPDISWDDFNFRRGPDPSHHQELATSDLIEVMKAQWSKNIHRPSMAGW